MKNLFLFCTLLILLAPAEIVATPPFPSWQGEQQTSKRDRTEWKTYQQRLNKLSSTFQQAKIDEVRTLYQALMTDIRREIAQVKAVNITNNHSIKYTEKLEASSIVSSRSLRLQEMQSIQKELRKRKLSPENKMQAEDKEVFTLLREFGSLMKAELLDQ